MRLLAPLERSVSSPCLRDGLRDSRQKNRVRTGKNGLVSGGTGRQTDQLTKADLTRGKRRIMEPDAVQIGHVTSRPFVPHTHNPD